MSSELATRIRSRGHMNVVIRPTSFAETRVASLGALERGFGAAHVQLRGWDYPHQPKEGSSRHQDFIQGVVSWNHHMEVWRLYQSGKFVHLFAIVEDWWCDSEWLKGHPQAKIPPGDLLEMHSLLFTMTEIFLFASRLAEALELGPELFVSYDLVGLENRRLQTLDPRRVQLGSERRAAGDLHSFGKELTLPVSDLLASAPEIAVDQTLLIYERFRWEPARQSLLEDQRKLIERRL